MNKQLNWLDKAKEYYLLALLAGLLFRSVNVYRYVPSIFDSVWFDALTILGAVLLLTDFIQNVRQKRFPYDKLLVLFIIIVVVSSFLNRQYGITTNLKIIYWSCVYYFIAYEFGKHHIDHESFFKKVNFALIVSWFLFVVGSLVMFFLHFGYEKYYTPRNRLRIGFLESRLFGLFGDPNYGAAGSVIVIILCLYYLYKKQGKVMKSFLTANIVLQYLYIVLSGSRTGEVVGYVALSLTLFLVVLKAQNLQGMALPLRILLALGSILASVLVLHTSVDLVKQLFTKVLQLTDKLPWVEHVSRKTEANTTLVRRDVAQNDDISNLRFKIWNSAFEIFKTNWLFGVSPRNILPYAKAQLPKGFIAEQGFIIHNSYLNVLTSTGVVGAVTFLSFCLKSVVSAAKKINWFGKLTLDFRYSYFLIVLSYAVFGCLNNEFVLEHTLGSLIFWLFLGRLVGKIGEKYE